MSFGYETDGELLSRFVGDGDQGAFDQVVRRHGGMVYRICARLCRSGPDAEDATQAVFVTLAQRAAELRGRTSLAGWLYRTAAHTALRQRRAAMTRRRHERVAGSMRPESDGGGDGLMTCDTFDELDRLHRALSALPEDYRNALILHHLEGHTVEQVAGLLATRPGTVAARLSRGRAMLRERLAVAGFILLAPEVEELLARLGGAEDETTQAAAISGSTTGGGGGSVARAATATGGGLAVAAAAPLSVGGAVKAAVILFGFSMVSLTAAAAASAYRNRVTAAPIGAPVAHVEQVTREQAVPPPAGIPSEWSTNVPEPGSLVVPASLALLLRRTRRPAGTGLLTGRTTGG